MLTGQVVVWRGWNLLAGAILLQKNGQAVARERGAKLLAWAASRTILHKKELTKMKRKRALQRNNCCLVEEVLLQARVAARCQGATGHSLKTKYEAAGGGSGGEEHTGS
jgi:hypothetical protein